MTLLSAEMLNSISFNSLEFINPYSQISEDSYSHRGKTVFLKGMHDIPGVLVVRYVDASGAIKYKFKSIEASIVESARKFYQRTIKKVDTISFAIIPTEKSNHSKVLKVLQKEHSSMPLDNNFAILKPWITGERTDVVPVDALSYRRPHMKYGREVRSSFHDYETRGGFYFIREKIVAENKIINAYVGKSVTVMADRIRNKFYPNEHLYYQEIPGVLEYHIAPIEVQRAMLPPGANYHNTILKYEKVLMNILDTRDNKKGRIISDNLTKEGYVAVLGDDEEGF